MKQRNLNVLCGPDAGDANIAPQGSRVALRRPRYRGFGTQGRLARPLDMRVCPCPAALAPRLCHPHPIEVRTVSLDCEIGLLGKILGHHHYFVGRDDSDPCRVESWIDDVP